MISTDDLYSILKERGDHNLHVLMFEDMQMEMDNFPNKILIIYPNCFDAHFMDFKFRVIVSASLPPRDNFEFHPPSQNFRGLFCRYFVRQLEVYRHFLESHGQLETMLSFLHSSKRDMNLCRGIEAKSLSEAEKSSVHADIIKERLYSDSVWSNYCQLAGFDIENHVLIRDANCSYITEGGNKLSCSLCNHNGRLKSRGNKRSSLVRTRSRNEITDGPAIEFEVFQRFDEALHPTEAFPLDNEDVQSDIVENTVILETELAGKNSCPVDGCHQIFSNQLTLGRHVKVEHVEALQCPDCGRQLSSIKQLKLHRRRHQGDYSHACPACGRGFVTLHELNLHEAAVHRRPDEAKFTCEVCYKTFRKKSALNTHLTVHTKEKKHICGQCGKVFTRRTHLTEHIRRTHPIEDEVTGTRTILRYKCEVCGKTLTGRQQLTRHSRIHTGEKPFTCHHCFKSFSRSHHLNVHLKRKHLQQPEGDQGHAEHSVGKAEQPAFGALSLLQIQDPAEVPASEFDITIQHLEDLSEVVYNTYLPTGNLNTSGSPTSTLVMNNLDVREKDRSGPGDGLSSPHQVRLTMASHEDHVVVAKPSSSSSLGEDIDAGENQLSVVGYGLVPAVEVVRILHHHPPNTDHHEAHAEDEPHCEVNDEDL